MSLLVSLILLLVIVALLIWASDLLPIPLTPKRIIQAAIILIAVVWLIQSTGVAA